MKKKINILIIILCLSSCLTTYKRANEKKSINLPKNLYFETKKINYREKLTGLSFTSLMLSGITFGLLPAYYSFEEEHLITIYSQEYKLLTEKINTKNFGSKYFWIPLIIWPSDKLEKSDIINDNEEDIQKLIKKIENKISIIDAKKTPILIRKSISEINSAGGVSIEMEIQNISQETIKYIEFDLELFNAVNDRIKCEIRFYENASAKLTGPLRSKEINKYYWENLWYNQTAEYFRIKNVKIIYFNHELKLNEAEIKEIQLD